MEDYEWVIDKTLSNEWRTMSGSLTRHSNGGLCDKTMQDYEWVIDKILTNGGL